MNSRQLRFPVLVYLSLIFLAYPICAEVNLDANGLPILPAIQPSTNSASTGPGKVSTETVHAAISSPPSTENKATEFSQYKAKVYQAVGAHWYANAHDQINMLPVGTVRIQYTISADGSVTTKVLSKVPPDLQPLMTISVKAIHEAAPFPAFPENMKKNLPTGNFTDEYSFHIYQGREGPR